MKSQFTLALAAAVALCANAEGRQQALGHISKETPNYQQQTSALQLSKKAPSRARAIQNFAGEYEWSRYDMLDYHRTLTSTVEFTLIDAESGQFQISGWPSGSTVTSAFIDPEAGTLKIKNIQQVGDMFGEPTYFYLKDSDGASWADGAIEDQEWATGTISGKDIIFPQYQIWTFGNYPDNYMYWTITNENKLTFLGEIEEEGSTEPIEGVEAIAGEYEYSFTGLLSNISGAQTSAITITVTNPATGEVSITGWPQNFAVKGTFSPSAGTLTIPNKQYLGKDQFGDDNYFYLKDVSNEGSVLDGASSVGASVGTVNGVNIIFPELDIWAIGDFNNESAGYWWMSYRNAFNGVDPNFDPNEGWEDFCTAVFEDGWVLTAYNIQGVPVLPADMPWTVNVQKSLTEEGTYRLDNPYKAAECPIPAEVVKDNGYIVFSLSEPEFVIVFPQIFSGAMTGSNKICCTNYAGHYLSLGYSKETIINAGLTSSTYDEETHVINIPECGFNFPGAADKYYTWSDADNQSLADNMNTTITLSRGTSAIANVEADDTNAPVVYYNLQGVRVENPANGVFIRVQGSQVTKVAK